MLRLVFYAFILALASGCAIGNVNSSPSLAKKVQYKHDGSPAITLFTMVNNKSGGGAHSSLLINASQRVIFDPAGTLKHDILVERGDVLFGINQKVLDFYTRAHARQTFHVVLQRIEVTEGVAEMALEMAMSNGAVAPALCAMSTSRLLGKLSGFEPIRTTYFPQTLRQQFGQLASVKEDAFYEYDNSDKNKALGAFTKEVSNINGDT